MAKQDLIGGELWEQYSNKVADRMNNPRNFGELTEADAQKLGGRLVIANEGAESCGDTVRLFWIVDETTEGVAGVVGEGQTGVGDQSAVERIGIVDLPFHLHIKFGHLIDEGFEDAVETSEEDEGEDHFPVLVGFEGIAEDVVGDTPDEALDLTLVHDILGCRLAWLQPRHPEYPQARAGRQTSA